MRETASITTSSSTVAAPDDEFQKNVNSINNKNSSELEESSSEEAVQLIELAEHYSRVLAESFYLENVRGNVFNFDSYINKAHSGLLDFLKSKSFIRDDENVLLRGLYHGHVPDNTPFKPPIPRQQRDKVDSISRVKNSTTTISRPLFGTASIPSPHHHVVSTALSTTNSSTAAANMRKFSEKMKAEASVVQRISELQKEGLWYDRRLPRIHEAARNKTHWDYLLEEMVWLAADFASERKWKRAASRRCAKMVDKYFSDRKVEQKRAEKEEEIKVRRIASRMAKEINNFWSNVQKLVEYKEQSRIEELRKKALDQQLSYIVDQTEKYSSMLAESFISDNNSFIVESTIDGTDDSSTTVDPNLTSTSASLNLSDDEFEPGLESGEDDEETIAKAEEDAKDVNTEIEALHRESLMSLDDFLDELPAGYIEECKARYNVTEEPEDASTSKTEEDNDTPKVEVNDTPAVQAEEQKNTEKITSTENSSGTIVDDTSVINVVESESTEIDEDPSAISTSVKELPGEEQLQKQNVSHEEAMDTGTTTQESQESDFDETGTEETEDEDEADDDDDGGSDDSTEITDGDSDLSLTEDELEPDEDEEQTVGLASLLQTFAPERAGEDHEDDPLNSVAAMAESFQPKGYTLSSTTVVTKVPFLLKHELREYQHIGLDWLVTMHEKKLNGILADEMGLGKTIQTIALLAHLACEKGNWGPHLIVVPTSVMLNWEMEFKKWCPGFKILTYYGSIKERRLKRTGWTKNNAFHVCITSYKLVIQDHASFRRKRWKYLILDEAQNIKNFKSQRWQLLLNFATHRRLLLTGTPLQNNLMELWSLMHFLMPNVFQSHREFREWFSNPMSGMVEGNSEYNENIIRRLHKVLRPFILRRLKLDVEKQLPQKYEHVVMCRLSKRQRYLYEEFMSRTKTKETLATGNLLSVINVLMQLRKVCNHPNLFESRPVISPFQSVGLSFPIPSIVWNMFALFELERLTRAVFSMSSADLQFNKSEAQHIWNLRPQGVEPLNGLTSSPSKLKRKRDDDSGETVMENDVVDTDITEYDYILQTTVVSTLPDGSIRCAPKRKRFLKWCADDLAVPVPRTTAPIPFFLMNVDPTPYLEDDNFVEVVGAGAPKPSGLQLSNERNSNGRIEIVTKSVQTSLDMADQFSRHIETSGFTPKSGGRITKKTSEASQLSTNTNDLVLKSSKKENLQDESEDDTDEEEPADDEEEEDSSLDEEDSDFSVEYEDVTPAGRKRKKKTSLIISRESKRLKTEQTKQEDGSVDENSIGENSEAISKDEYESSCSDDDTLVKRNKIRFTPAQSIKGLLWARSVGLNPAEFQEADVQLRSIQDRRALIERLQCINDRRCEIIPVMGADTIDQCKVIGQLPRMRVYGTRVRHLGLNYKGHSARRDYKNNGYFNRGYEEVYSVSTLKNSQSSTRLRNHPLVIWRHTKALIFLIKTLEEVLEEYTPTLKRFMLYVPAVSAPVLSPRVFRPNPSEYLKQLNMEQELKEVLRKPTEIFHPIISSMTTQFPDPRLIQYDCGKLQVLDGLLRRLKAGNHRILIFTQMARMLDVLEVFLNYHGYIYLRLDGATKIDQRQLLMEKFNTDTRIFCFILSTRSGGIGVNLTGADSVIFYDSDWNPTMDAQAQDRCHRIGQTRDVHIYRLVSEKTVEENILKKSNQKRLLGELAINDGNFTTAFFAKQSIKDLFEVRTDKPEAVKRLEASVDIVEVEKTPEEQQPIREKSVSPPPPSPKPCIVPELVEETMADDTSKPPEVEKSQIQLFETALAAAEDEMDVQATRTVKAEAAAELAEFDESIPLEELGDGQDMVESSMVDIEMQSVMAELNAVERYALKFMESTIDDWSTETVAQAQKEMEQQKREWELEQMRKLESQMKASPELSDEEDLLTYSSSDAQNQVWISQGEEVMPLWAPPTPPQDEDDVYFDPCHGFLYDFSIIPESSLPPVYSPPKKEKKFMNTVSIPLKINPATISALCALQPEEECVGSIEKKPKIPRRDDPIFAPRSLFDRPSPQMAKLRRDYRLQKYNCRPTVAAAVPKQTLGPGAITFPIVHPSSKAPSPPPQHESVEWMIAEDYALLQIVQNVLELPLSLLVVNLAQTPNWDLAAEMVNMNSRTYRTPKQCKLRYETIVGPREEGKIIYEQPASVKPKKKVKGTFIKLSPPSPSKTGRIIKMSQLMSSDNNSQLMNTFLGKFDACKHIANKRPAVSKPMTLNPHMKSNKQSTIFTEHSINFDNPLPATAIAVARQERIQLERKKLYAAQQSAVGAPGGQAAAHPVIAAAVSHPVTTASTPHSVTAASASHSVTTAATSHPVTTAALQAAMASKNQPSIQLQSPKQQVVMAYYMPQSQVQQQKQQQGQVHFHNTQGSQGHPSQTATSHPVTTAALAAAMASKNQPTIQLQSPKQVVVASGGATQSHTVTTATTSHPVTTAALAAMASKNQPSIQLQSPKQQVVMAYYMPQSQVQQQKQQQGQVHFHNTQGSQGHSSQTATSHPVTTTASMASKSQPAIQLQSSKQVVVASGGATQSHTVTTATTSHPVTTAALAAMASKNQPTIQLQSPKVVMAYQPTQSQTQQQKQQQTQVHVHFHNPQGNQGIPTQTMVIPQGFSLGVAGSQNIGSNQLAGLMTTASVTSSGTTSTALTATASFPRTRQTISQQLTQPGQPQGRTVTMQLVKQHTVGGKTVTRTVSDAEVAAFLKQHGLTSSARVAIAGQPGTQAQIGQLTTKGQLTQVQVPTAQLLTSSANVAFAGQSGTQTQIGQLTTKGQLTQVQVPTAQLLTSSANVAFAGQSGTQTQIGQLSSKGQLTQVQVPTAQILTSVELQKLGLQIAPSNSGTVLKTPASQAAGSQGTSLTFPVSFSQVKNVSQKTGGQVTKQGQISNIQQQLLAQRRQSQQQHQSQQQQPGPK